MRVVLWNGAAEDWPRWEGPLAHAFAEAEIALPLVREAAPGDVAYILHSKAGVVQDFGPYDGLTAVLSLWAGVEQLAVNPTLTAPLARMVDPAMTEAMTEWVVGQVLRHHLGLDAILARQTGEWRQDAPPIARERTVGVLGLGALGAAAAGALAALNFRVLGWSRSAKDLPGIACHHGAAGLSEVLAAAEIVSAILPQTAGTENLLDAPRLAAMRPGAVLINSGRGTLIDDAALLAALDRGHLAHATLDVFREEPLPPDHPFWSHPRVTVSPHISAETRPESAARILAANIRRGEAGEALHHLYDPARGY
ncbi:MAG: NAD(P)-dependent oxidoreductase [Pseudomonadota bacterium]